MRVTEAHNDFDGRQFCVEVTALDMTAEFPLEYEYMHEEAGVKIVIKTYPRAAVQGEAVQANQEKAGS